MRILHLIDSIHTAPSPLRLTMMAAVLRQQADSRSAVWALGGASLAGDARDAGIEVDEHLGAADRVAAAARLRSLMRLRRDAFDAIHTWSLDGAVAASAALLPRRMPIVISLLDPPRVDWMAHRLLRGRDVTILAAGSSLRQDLIACGFSDAQVQVIEPGIEAPAATLARDDHPRRAAQRLAWGVTDPRTAVVLALADPPRRLDGMTAMLSVGLAAETGRPVRLLISPSAGGLERAQRMAAASRRSNVLLVDDAADRPWEALAGIDIGLALDENLAVHWAMRAGLPLVAAPGMNPQLVDGETALVGGDGSPGEIARRVCRLHDDAELARRLGSAAAAATADLTPEPYAARIAAVYESMQSLASI